MDRLRYRRQIACGNCRIPKQDLPHKLGAIIAPLRAVADMKSRKPQPQIIIVIFFPFPLHGLQGAADGIVLLGGHCDLQHLRLRIGKTLEGTEPYRFRYKPAPKRVVRMAAAEGIHQMQISIGADGRVIVLSAGDLLQDTGKESPGLGNNDINFLLRILHGGTPFHPNSVVIIHDLYHFVYTF